PPPSFGQHRLGEVYPERRPVPREPCRVTSRLTGAAADVEHTIGRRDRVRLEKASPDRAKAGVVLVGELGPLVALLAIPGVRHIDVGNRLTHTTLLARGRIYGCALRLGESAAVPHSPSMTARVALFHHTQLHQHGGLP